MLSTYIYYNINNVFDEFYAACHGLGGLNLTAERAISPVLLDQMIFLLLKMVQNASIQTIGFRAHFMRIYYGKTKVPRYFFDPRLAFS